MIEKKLNDVRRGLLDLTRNNRLLNHRPGGQRTLQIFDELPAEVFRILVEEDQTMQFLAREEAPDEIRTSLPKEYDGKVPVQEVAAPSAETPTSNDAPPAPPVVSPEPALLPLAPIAHDTPAGPKEAPVAERHRDRNLQTLLSTEKLQTRLVHLAREANSALEELGCNILYLTLGIVEWCEADQSDIVSRAPLLFVPVELKRKNVNARYSVHVFDDDLVANQSLIQLCQAQFNFKLPDFDPEKGQINEYFAAVEQSISGMKNWKLSPQIYLGLFSFSKLLMYGDLDPTRWPDPAKLTGHPMIQALTGIPSAAPATETTSNGDGIPDPRTLDQIVKPVECFQIVDADSSQQAAILAAKRGMSMVIDGPPGTGKSQTITNIIAECLAEGKTVLFVSEKAAALEVVKRRLEQRDMGDFVLELHSRQASKKAVLYEITRVFEKQPDLKRVPPQTAEELAKVRQTLNEYHRQLHEPLSALDVSPFTSMSRAIGLSSEPETDCEIPDVMNWTGPHFVEAQEKLKAIDRRLARVGDASQHPWRGVGLFEAGLKEKQRITRSGDELQTAIASFLAAAAQLANQLSLPAPVNLRTSSDQSAVAKFLLEVPPVLASAAKEERWNTLRPELNEWLNLGAQRQKLRTWLAMIKPAAHDRDWQPVLQRRKEQQHSFLKFLFPSWRADTRLLREFSTSEKLPPVEKQIEILSALVQCAELTKKVQAQAGEFSPLFGTGWKGIDDDWDVLRKFAEQAVTLRQMILARRIDSDTAGRILTMPDRSPLVSAANAAQNATAALDQSWRNWLTAIASDEKSWIGEWQSAELSAVATRLAELRGKMELLDDWIDLRRALHECSNTPLRPFIDWAITPKAQDSGGKLDRVFARHFYRLWMEEALRQRPALRGFRGQDHEAVIRRFRELDEQWLDMTRLRLAERLAARRPEINQAAHRQSKLGLLQAEVRKKSRHMPLRKLLREVGEVVQTIKPCFMMSPLSIAQYLAPGGLEFDVVIFDEASQVEPADAYGAVVRGRQLLLVGDERQLPPTSFFQRSDPDEADRGDDTELRARDVESVLSLGIVRLPHRCGLRWHYRSRHSSLIEFSNLKFYDGQLRVFPSPHTDCSELGVAFEHVESAVYQRGAGRMNPIEAAKVAEAVIEHALNHPEHSLGVGTLNFPQQRAIEDEIEKIRRNLHEQGDEKHELIETFYAEMTARGEPFFVKNLENIQGDERDVILLSIGFGKDATGRLSLNFGALNDENGWRRLNVLITRARMRCVVFSSIRHDEIDLGGTSARGIVALKEYLNFAEHGRVQDMGAPGNEHDSEFEAAVCQSIRQMGWEVHAQVGCAGFAIDLAVVDPRAPGRYLLGIECDGATYHSSPTARDRDRLRQEVLENLGWTIHRIWSSDFFARPEAELTRLKTRLDELKNQPPKTELPKVAKFTAPKVSEKSVPAQQLRASENSLQPGVVSYETFRASVKNGEAMLDRPADFTKLLGKLLAVESPIHMEEAARAAAQMLGAKVTSRFRQKLDSALTPLLDAGAQKKGDFLWHWETKEATVRFRGHDCPVTSAELICPEEFEAAILLAATHQFGVKFDAVAEAAAHAMGFTRTGAKIKSALDQALIRLDQSGKVEEDSAGFVVLKGKEK